MYTSINFWLWCSADSPPVGFLSAAVVGEISVEVHVTELSTCVVFCAIVTIGRGIFFLASHTIYMYNNVSFL